MKNTLLKNKNYTHEFWNSFFALIPFSKNFLKQPRHTEHHNGQDAWEAWERPPRAYLLSDPYKTPLRPPAPSLRGLRQHRLI